MTERTDRKLCHVAVGRYGFRHEAEFAAGFLDDADIPHRLQIDDPAMGFALGSSATIWVLEMDLQRAREILEVSDEEVTVSPVLSTKRPDRSATVVSSELNPRERLMAVAGSLGVAGTAATYFGVGSNPTWIRLIVVIVVVLFAMGVVGRAPRPIKRVLRALSGNAP